MRGFQVRSGGSGPLRKPIALPERNAIHFRNAQTPANREAAGSSRNRTFPLRHGKSFAGHRELFPSGRRSRRDQPLRRSPVRRGPVFVWVGTACPERAVEIGAAPAVVLGPGGVWPG